MSTVGGMTAASLSSVDAIAAAKQPFMISLAERSIQRALQSRRVEHVDFPRVARQECGIEAIEVAASFFSDHVRERQSLAEFRRRAEDVSVRILLVMVDSEEPLCQADSAKRKAVVEAHFKWVEAAKHLGCHSIRVSLGTTGTSAPQEQMARAVDGLRQLAEFATRHGINVLAENRGGLSANGVWLAEVLKAVDLPNCGSLPSFVGFDLGNGKRYDAYQGVAELMPLAKAVTAASSEFDSKGNETSTDYRRMLEIVVQSGYRGYVGIEYTGERLAEAQGIKATKTLLERVRQELVLANRPLEGRLVGQL